MLALAALAFVALWCVIPLVLSRISGWAALANAYPAKPTMGASSRWAWQSVRMNGTVRYNGAVTVIADTRMAHFSVFTLLRLGHQPLSVPWEDIRAEQRDMLLARQVALTFARAPEVTMLIRPSLMQRLADASAGRLTL
jgi:hypothetical protein